MVDTLLERETSGHATTNGEIEGAVDVNNVEEARGEQAAVAVEWPDFSKQNVFVQMFTVGVNAKKQTKPTTGDRRDLA